MFYVSNGWLQYRPFDTYVLPDLVMAGRHVLLQRNQEDPGQSHPLYELRWPGKIDKGHVGIPTLVCQHWHPERYSGPANLDSSAIDIRELLKDQRIPEEPPESVAYHLAVNQQYYIRIAQDEGIDLYPYPVAGLPSKCVEKVLSAPFVIKPEYLSALKYLKWLAESHRHHPFFKPFETTIREQLVEVSTTAAYHYFKLLQDCIYDPSAHWWSRDPAKSYWGNLACYLHWVGRTGSGVYERNARIRGPYIPDDIKERLDYWLRTADSMSRASSHVTGKNPTEMEIKNSIDLHTAYPISLLTKGLGKTIDIGVETDHHVNLNEFASQIEQLPSKYKEEAKAKLREIEGLFPADKEAPEDKQPTVRILHGGEKAWGGPGWYFYEEDCPEEGSYGVFLSQESAWKIATSWGFTVSVSSRGRFPSDEVLRKNIAMSRRK